MDLAWFIPDVIQTILEEDRTQILGRQKSEGGQAADTRPSLPEWPRQEAEVGFELWYYWGTQA